VGAYYGGWLEESVLQERDHSFGGADSRRLDGGRFLLRHTVVGGGQDLVS